MGPEAKREKKAKTAVEKMGGMFLKFVSPGRRGVPDRLIGLNGVLYLAEFKADGGTYSPIQKFMIKEFWKRRIKVYDVSTDEKLNDFLKFLKQQNEI